MQNEPATSTDAPPIADRPESVGFWGKAWPVLALGFITLLFLRACVPAAPPPPASFDVAAATQAANARAIAALDGITANSSLDEVLKALNLPAINFPSGSAEIPAAAKPVLAKVAAVMKTLPADSRFEVGGHTDNSGNAEANQLLSRQRAQAVADFLVENGVARERLVVQGYGDAKPVASNATEEGRFHNRRIEFKPPGR